MKIILKNYQLETVLAAIINASEASGRIDGLTQLKLNKARRVIFPVYKDYSDLLPDLKEAHVKKDKNGEFKTKMEDGILTLDFKSEKDKEKFKEVSGQDNIIDLPYLLREADLKQLQVTGQEIEGLMLIMEGEAVVHEERKKSKKKAKAG